MESSVPPAREARPPSAEARAAIADGWRRARRAHRNLTLTLEGFTDDVLGLLHRSRLRLGLPLEEDALREDATALHYEDLYLARLCEQGNEPAWQLLVERYAPDLRAVLRRNWDAAEAETVAAEVLSSVSLAPADGRSRTRLGTYDGTGPLWAWLATIGFRTARHRWRRRREVPIESANEQVAPPAAPSEPELTDQVDRFVDALRETWRRLEPRERLVLGWKHGDGLPQKAIARLLGTSEPTVSRLVARAIAKLQGALSRLSEEGLPSDPALWTRLERALTSFLERTHALRPPDVE